MMEYYEYLAENLFEAINHFQDSSMAAHQICIILSIVKDIPETHFRMYTECLNLNKNLFKNAIAYFSGMEKINVQCDCTHDVFLCDIVDMKSGPFFELGKLAMSSKNEIWASISDQVSSIKLSMEN